MLSLGLFFWQHSLHSSKWEWFPPRIHQSLIIPPALCCEKKKALVTQGLNEIFLRGRHTLAKYKTHPSKSKSVKDKFKIQWYSRGVFGEWIEERPRWKLSGPRNSFSLNRKWHPPSPNRFCTWTTIPMAVTSNPWRNRWKAKFPIYDPSIQRWFLQNRATRWAIMEGMGMWQSSGLEWAQGFKPITSWIPCQHLQ